MNNVIKSPYDIRDYKIKPTANFPASFSLETVNVKNQGIQSTCVAHVLSSVCEYHYRRQHNTYKDFSTEFIFGFREDNHYKGDAMSLRQALSNLQKYGDVFESDCPGNHSYNTASKNVAKNLDELKELAYPHRVTSYVRIESADELKTALMNYGPVAVSMYLYKNDSLKNDIYSYNSNSEKRGAHCVYIYGWDERGWLVQNSWGVLYGWDGRFVIPYDFKFNEMWGIIDDMVEDNGNIIKPKRNKWLDIIYKIINFIMNLKK